MSGKELLDKMSDVDPKLIVDAEKKTSRKRGPIIGITSGVATVAAAAVIAVTLGRNPAVVPPVNSTSEPYTSSIDSGSTSSTQKPQPFDPPEINFNKYKDLPKISDRDYGTNAMGGGLGGVRERSLCYSDLERSGPWKGAELETLPVFISHSTDRYPDLDRMYACVREAAAALGIPADSLEITDSYHDMNEAIEAQIKMAKEAGATDEEIEDVINRMIRGSMSSVSAETNVNGIRISVDTAYGTYIHFEEPIKLPDEYNFSKDATAEERTAVLNYLSDKYKDLIKFGKPTAGDGLPYNLEGFSLYDADCDLTQQIINFRVNAVCFGDYEGKLSVIYILTDGACEKLGDYPILTAAQAEEILKSNKYDDYSRMPANANILKTELVYKNASGYTAVMPYYEFYVETDKEPSAGDEVTCDIYTIAAVPEEFIDMEVTDYAPRA